MQGFWATATKTAFLSFNPKHKFLNAFSRYFEQKDAVIRNCLFVLNQLKMQEILRVLKKSDSVLETFDENIWMALVETLTVFHDGSMVFLFKDGTEVKV